MSSNEKLTKEIQAFIGKHTKLAPASFVPELSFYQADVMESVWRAMEVLSGDANVPFPFWAFVWPGGQAMGRHILDYPEIVRGKRVLDLACGSGIIALAAHKAGATKVMAADIDPMARASMALNAAHNETEVQIVGEVDMTKPPKKIDLIMAGDICYEQRMSHRILRWLTLCKKSDIRVLVADPKRGYAPDRNPDVAVTELAAYTVPTSRELEESDTRDVIIWEVEAYLASC